MPPNNKNRLVRSLFFIGFVLLCLCAPAICAETAGTAETAAFGEALERARRDPQTKPEDLVKHITNLALACQDEGDFVPARSLLEEAVKIAQEKLPDNHALKSVVLNNLGSLIYFQGDFTNAAPILESAFKEGELAFGAQSPEVAKVLTNLAGIYSNTGQNSLSIRTYERALKILDRPDNADPLTLAQTLNNLAVAYESAGDSTKAMQLLKRALALKEKVLGSLHADVAESYNNIAVLTAGTGDHASAIPLLQKAVEIYEKAEGPTHLDVANVLNNLGDVHLRSNNPQVARECFLKSSAILDQYRQKIFTSLSFGEQKSWIDLQESDSISRLLSASSPANFDATVYDLLLPWKGLLIESLAREAKLSRLAANTELAQQREELNSVRTELAAWYQAAGDTNLAQWQQKNLALTKRKEDLQRFFAQKLGSQVELSKMTSASLAAVLKPDEAFIDYYYYDLVRPDGTIITSIAAVLTFRDGEKTALRFVQLGPADSINVLLEQWRIEVANQESASAIFEKLREPLMAPIKALPVNITRIWVCPEAELACAPWQLMSHDLGKSVSQIDSARELVALRSEYQESVAEKQQTAFVLGGVDFDAVTGAQPATTGNSPAGGEALFHLPPLPGSLREAQGIAKLAREQNMNVIERTGKDATKSAVRSNLTASNFGHLATHGYFMDSRMMDQIRVLRNTPRTTRGVALISRRNQLASRNPLVESGIALAGANRESATANERQGFLTAEEMVGLDMRNCRLITLSACDTGKGQAITGQGLMGLRSAIMAGGSRSLLISLWNVPDVPTTKLMQYFYENLWVKKMSPFDALHKAKETLRAELPAELRVPINWAGWELIGEVW